MNKIVVHRAGGLERLKLEQHPDPSPGPGEVLVEVAAAGVNFADVIVRMGMYSSAKKYVGWPITPGFEVAGRVLEPGPGVDDLSPGDEVLAVTRFGAYVTRLVVPRQQVFRRPAALTAEQAAGFPVVFLTAYYAIHLLVHPRAGDSALVHSAAGGVGGALLQILRLAGCRSVGVVGASHKLDSAREQGADQVIDKSSEALWPAARAACPDGYDAVYDGNGPSTARQSYRALAPAGKLVIYGHHSFFSKGRARPNPLKLALQWLRMPRFNPLDLTDDNKCVLAFNLSYLFHRGEALSEAMERLLGWLQDGSLKPPPVTTYPLAQVAEAHRALESGQTVGKLVLVN
jgi:NADPH:quinone reductase-like Zn-dependent oxidoreductase